MKILLADDHPLIRSGLRGELRALDTALEFIEAWDAQSLAQMFDAHRDIDLALVDLNMPGMRGAATIAALRESYPTVPLIVVSGVVAEPDVRAVLRAGAAGYIPKGAMSRVMLQAIRLVLAGGRYLPPQLLRELDGSPPQAAADAGAQPAPEVERLQQLSPRQQEVFALLAQGLPNKAIARRLDISEGTVKSHIAAIFDLLGVHNRVAAVAEARKLSQGRDPGP